MNFSENKKYISLPNNHQQEQKEKIMKQPQNIYRIIWTKVLFLKTILLITCHFKKKIIKMPWQYYWQQLHGTFGKGHDTWWFLMIQFSFNSYRQFHRDWNSFGVRQWFYINEYILCIKINLHTVRMNAWMHLFSDQLRVRKWLLVGLYISTKQHEGYFL